MLTDARCRGARREDKAYKLTDADGLFLYITPTGHRSWRYRYRFGGKQKQVVLGSYPELTLRVARELRDEKKSILRREVLRTSDSAEASPTVVLASRFLALTAQRPGMIRWLRWDELHNLEFNSDSDCPNAVWIVPAEKIKH